MMRYLVLVLFIMSFAPLDIGLTGLASAVDIDFDCPDEIFVDEEFECVLEVFDGDGEYDVKVELDQERDSVLKIWDGDVWKSGYYYLTDFIEDGEDRDVRLKVSEDGNFDGLLKLRQGDKREFFDIEIEVALATVGSSVEPMVGSDSENLAGSQSEIMVGSSLRDGDVVAEVISLNGAPIIMEDDVNDFVYVSKDARVVDYLVYGFAVFLIFVIVILVWERR